MAERQRTVGRGNMTAYVETVADGPDLAPAARAWFRRWNEALRAAGGSGFGAVTADMMAQVKAVVAAVGDGPVEAQSVEYLARQIADYHRKVAGLIASVPAPRRPDVDRAARFAFTLGRLWGEAVMQDLWNDAAMRGLDVAAGAARGGRSRAADIGRRDRDLELAREYQRRRPGSRLSDSALKADIGKHHVIKENGRPWPPIGRSAAIAAINRGLKML